MPGDAAPCASAPAGPPTTGPAARAVSGAHDPATSLALLDRAFAARGLRCTSLGRGHPSTSGLLHHDVLHGDRARRPGGRLAGRATSALLLEPLRTTTVCANSWNFESRGQLCCGSIIDNARTS